VYSIWDKRLTDGKNYRQLLTGESYKGNRDKERSERVYANEELTSKLLSELGVRNMYPGILEGDDVIAWLCKNVEGEKIVVSADQDMLQLINSETTVYSPIKDILIDSSNFTEAVGIDMENFVKYKALMGDKSDNIEGLPKCGPKTAIKLIKMYPTDEDLEANLQESSLNIFLRNRKLVDLNHGVKEHPEDIKIYEKQYAKLKDLKPDFNKFESTCRSYNMKKIVDNIHTWKTAFNKKTLALTLESIVNSLDLG
jgi:5'-3' exonuclease